METPRKFIIAELSIRNLVSLSVLIIIYVIKLNNYILILTSQKPCNNFSKAEIVDKSKSMSKSSVIALNTPNILLCAIV